MPSKKSTDQGSKDKKSVQMEIIIKAGTKTDSTTRTSKAKKDSGADSLLRCIKGVLECLKEDGLVIRVIRE